MSNSIPQLAERNHCTGCTSCASICPKHIIKMEADKEGFLYPVIDSEKCISCHLCEKACPILHPVAYDEPHFQKGFLAQNKDEIIRQESTSGGVFTVIASWVIRKGGVVFGAGYQKGTFVVVHQAVENVEDLSIFRNSKYVQSEIRDSFKQALNYLKDGRLVLFSGTPCQIEGFLSFLGGKIYKNLILQDLVCRGIPSPAILDSYLSLQQQKIGGKFENVLFRDKYYGYHYSSFSIYNSDKSKDYHKGVDTNAYLRAFFNNLSDRPSCYNCQFKNRYRRSDLTLWDCFPVEQFTRLLDGKGTTRVLVQSEKGRDIMEAVANQLRIVEIEPDKLVKGVREMFHSVPMNPKRDVFFHDFRTLQPEEFFNKWFPINWKVKLNAFVRLFCHRLGLYTYAKRVFLLFYTRRDIRNSKKVDTHNI